MFFGSGAGKGENKTMKKNKMTTKALSVFLTVIMLFTTISVGLIVPETKVTADAAEVGTIAELNQQIANANTAGTGVVTTIKLKNNISYSGSLASFTELTSANIVFDFNGYSLLMNYTVSGEYESNQQQVQLPSANQNKTHAGTDTFTNGMFIVRAGSTLQIINSKPGNTPVMQVYTDFADTKRNKDLTHQTSSSLIYSEGKLIIGSTNTNYNDFRLYAHSSCRATNGNNPLTYGEKTANANAYTITVNDSNAIFKMYGGQVYASAVSRARRGGDNNLRLYALNLNKCYSAEVYGGEISLPDSPFDTYSGLRQSSDTASGGANAVMSAIRCNEAQLYIFNVKSEVRSIAGADTSKNNSMTVSNIYAASANNPVNIYGGYLYFYSEGHKGNDNSTATTHSSLVRGPFNLASAGKLQNYSGDSYESVSTGRDANNSRSVSVYTVFVGDNGVKLDPLDNSKLLKDANGNLVRISAENGIDMFSYNTFREYLAQYSSTLDTYFGDTIMTTNGDANGVLGSHNYLLNGYTHYAWAGHTHPGELPSLSKTTPTNASITGGGSLFLVPAWQENVYTISYDWDDKNYLTEVLDKSSCPVNYKITDTKQFGSPVRPGYQFNNWAVTSYNYPDTDTKKTAWSLATYPAGFPLNGKNGNITIKGSWTPLTYEASFDYAGGKDVNGNTSISPKRYTVNDSNNITFPIGLTKNYYDFTGQFEVTLIDNNGCSWVPGTKYAAGSSFTQGNYGNVTFKAVYTPTVYTVRYDSAGGTFYDDGTYTYESTNTLPLPIRTGYDFAGWQPTTNTGSWEAGRTYSAGTSFNKMHGNVTLEAKWTSGKSTVTLKTDDSVSTHVYTFSSPLTVGGATKTGYDFKGWEVDVIPSYTDDVPVINRWQKGFIYYADEGGNVEIEDGMVGDVTLKPVWEAHQYTINLDYNNGSTVTEKTYYITEKVSLPEITKDGYVFDGWIVTAHGDKYNWTDTKYDAKEYDPGLYGDVTLTAQWKNATYTVTFDPNGGEVPKTSVSYDVDNRPEFVSPSRKGYDFLGWQVTDKGTSNWTADAVYTTELPFGLYGNVTLTAQWSHKQYEIEYDIPGSGNYKKYYYIDSTDVFADNATSPGYRFLYWEVTKPDGDWTRGETITAGTPITGKTGNVGFTAKFDPIVYTITYLDIDGNITKTVDYTMNDAVNVEVFTCPGYTCNEWIVEKDTSEASAGWSDTAYFGQREQGACYGNVTLRPNATPESYKITFVPDGGTPYPDMEYTIESTDTLPVPEKTGYNFLGWEVTTESGNWEASQGLIAGNTAVTDRYGNATLTAKWAPKTYTITWVTGAGTFTTDGTYNEMPVPSGVDTSKAPDAQYTYTFSGWSPSLTLVTGETTYTAQYSKTVNTYTVTWIYDVSESETKTETAEYKYGVHPVFNNGANPTKTSVTGKYYRFVGWKDADGNLLTDATTVQGNVTYTAEYKEIEAPRTVTWVIDGVSHETKWAVGETPSYVGVPSKPDKNGMKYTFTGWTPSITKVQANTDYTYTAQFTEGPQTYVAEFDLNGGSYSGATEVEYNKTAGLNMPHPEKAGYSFAGWKVVSNSGTWTATSPYTYSSYTGNWGDVSFIASYTATEYTIKVEAADGTTPEHKYTIESTATLPSYELDGFTLTGWMVVSGEGSWVTGDTIPTDKVLTGMYGNVTLLPLWTARLYKINWVSGDVTQTVEFTYGDPVVTYPPLTKAGYTAQWDKTVPAIMPAEDLTFNAVYTPIQYYLRFNSAGGSAVENFYYDITSSSVLPTPVREGATFRGWKVSAGTGSWNKTQIYAGGTSLTGMYGNITLTAVWEIQLYTVTWVIDAENGIKKISKWYHGAVPSFDGTPYKASDDSYSYTFTGWDKEIVTVTGDVEYTAQYTTTPRLYTITWNIDGYTTTQLYKYGQMPVYEGKEPTRESTVEYDFTFAGWSPSISQVTKDITYTAVFDVFTKLQGVRVDKSAVFLKTGETAVLTAIISPVTASNKDVQWVSSDENIATVDSNGRVTAVGSGDALVSVQSKDGQFRSYCLVSVSPVITEYLVVSAGYVSTTRLPGEAIQLTARVMPENATNKNVKWSSSDTTIAMVDENGLVVFGDVPGTAIITASADGYATGSIEVTTTTKSSEIEENEKTYVVMFLESSSSYIIGGNTYEAITIICSEGDSIEFLLTEPHFVTANGIQFPRDTDGVYRIKDLDQNYSIIATERADLGFEEDPEEQPQNKLSFFDRIKAFFRSIVEFFRNLFG